MAEILTRTYTYTGETGWILGESAVPVSSFAVSGDSRPIVQILSIRASWYSYHDTSSTVEHTAEVILPGGTVLASAAVSMRGDGEVFQIDADFLSMPAAADWVESELTLCTTLNTKHDSTFWTATAERPMSLTITYTSVEFKPSIANAKIYRADESGAAADNGTGLSFTAMLAVQQTGENGSGVFAIYCGDSSDAATNLIYTLSGIEAGTAGVTISQAPIPDAYIGSGEKKWFRMVFTYEAQTESGSKTTETVSALFLISHVFTNVHLSGHATGGVCFGGYSTAQAGEPKFECHYPAYFYGGAGGPGFDESDEEAVYPGKSFDGKTRYVRRMAYTLSGNGVDCYSAQIADNIARGYILYGALTRSSDGKVFPLNFYRNTAAYIDTAITLDGKLVSRGSAAMAGSVEAVVLYVKNT